MHRRFYLQLKVHLFLFAVIFFYSGILQSAFQKYEKFLTNPGIRLQHCVFSETVYEQQGCTESNVNINLCDCKQSRTEGHMH